METPTILRRLMRWGIIASTAVNPTAIFTGRESLVAKRRRLLQHQRRPFCPSALSVTVLLYESSSWRLLQGNHACCRRGMCVCLEAAVQSITACRTCSQLWCRHERPPRMQYHRNTSQQLVSWTASWVGLYHPINVGTRTCLGDNAW